MTQSFHQIAWAPASGGSCGNGAMATTLYLQDMLYCHVPTRAESFAWEANQAADEAMFYGVQGFEATALAYARLAEVYTMLAGIYRAIEGDNGSIVTTSLS